MSIKIVDVDQLDNRVLVNFEDGVCAASPRLEAEADGVLNAQISASAKV